MLAANPAARVISPKLVAGRNRLRPLLLDDTERALYGDWHATARRFVAVVREVVGRHAADSGFAGLIDELRACGPQFTELWDRHDVVASDTEVATFRHPSAGDLRLHLERLDVTGVTGQSLVVYHPVVGSRDADLLAALLAGQASAHASGAGA